MPSFLTGVIVALRQVVISTASVTVLAGPCPTATSGFVDGIGTNARLAGHGI